MIIDVDLWLPEDPENDSPVDRVFPFDLFISHRRFDSPTALVDSLRAFGATVTWDFDLDLRDRRVMHGVARAMRLSRFVGLYVSNEFLDSPWCRAEYLSAMRVEKTYRIPRILVICESDQARSLVPEDLHAASRFVLSKGGAQQLSEFVAQRNRAGQGGTGEKLRRIVPAGSLEQDTSLLLSTSNSTSSSSGSFSGLITESPRSRPRSPNRLRWH